MPPDQTDTVEAVEPAFVDVVQRILDENSAWVASPNRQVTESIAIRAFVAARMSYEDMHTPATEMMRQRDDARQQRDEHFAEIERARDVIAGQRLEADRLRSRIMELEKALGPFATYLGSRGGLDNNGAPLPGEQAVGWVYLTYGDFRAAARVLTKEDTRDG